MALERLRTGACLLAAATTLYKESSIATSEEDNNQKGISVSDVLPHWTVVEAATLLGRPILEPAILRFCSFHHRSVLEYLTAEWLHKLIIGDASRKRVEQLFFRTMYDIEAVIPTMRPVLCWLAIMDDRILGLVRRLAPEILFEGGDLSRLPLPVRIDLLREACASLALPAHTLPGFKAGFVLKP